jgi:FAD binding domain
MLEVRAGEGYGQWDDDRIWAELEQRLAAAGRPPVRRGEFLERDILDHRVRVCDPMQHGRVFLAGDAAHLITPAGGKGMNIAIQDAVELACGLTGVTILRECVVLHRPFGGLHIQTSRMRRNRRGPNLNRAQVRAPRPRRARQPRDALTR